jgi:hypothetical protein
LYDGADVDDFDEATSYYTVELDDDADIPAVSAVANDSDATVSITQATEIPGTAKVVVTAEDGTTTKTYRIHFVYQ